MFGCVCQHEHSREQTWVSETVHVKVQGGLSEEGTCCRLLCPCEPSSDIPSGSEGEGA